MLLPPTVYKVGRKVFRHTIEESKLAFIDHKPVGTNLVEYLDEAKASRPYPYVLSLGNDIRHSSQAFVILTDILPFTVQTPDFTGRSHKAPQGLNEREVLTYCQRFRSDRVVDQKAVCSFTAEHDLSFTILQPLVNMCKKLAEDKIPLLIQE
ncbi:hypothetical protein ABVT39_020344 [Epinephelus coioides]